MVQLAKQEALPKFPVKKREWEKKTGEEKFQAVESERSQDVTF